MILKRLLIIICFFLCIYRKKKRKHFLLFRGYHGDLNETLFVGEVSEKARNLVINTWECLEKAITECVKPGTKYRLDNNFFYESCMIHTKVLYKTITFIIEPLLFEALSILQ